PVGIECEERMLFVVRSFPWRGASIGAWWLAVVLAISCAMLIWQIFHLRSAVVAAARSSSRHVEYFWSNLFPNGRPVSLVTSDANLLFLSNFINRTPSLDEYRAQGYPANLILEHVTE